MKSHPQPEKLPSPATLLTNPASNHEDTPRKPSLFLWVSQQSQSLCASASPRETRRPRIYGKTR